MFEFFEALEGLEFLLEILWFFGRCVGWVCRGIVWIFTGGRVRLGQSVSRPLPQKSAAAQYGGRKIK